jgi:hypothetical protein
MYPNIKGPYRNRHGKWVCYYRSSPQIRLPLPAEPNFHERYHAAKAVADGGPTIKTPSLGAIPASFRWGCEIYMRAEHSIPETVTQRERRLRFEAMWREEYKCGDPSKHFGDYPLALFKTDHIRVLRDRKKNHKAAANARLRDLNLLFAWLLKNEKGGIKFNPASYDRIDKFVRKDAGHHHDWTDAERQQYCARHSHGSLARRCYDLLFFAGPAVCDAIRMGSHTVDGDSLSVPARGVRSTSGLVDGSGPQQPDPSTARDAGVAPVSPLSTALAGLVMVRIAVGSGLQQPANPETDHDHRQTAPCGAYREGV